MKPISYMLDPVSGVSSHPALSTRSRPEEGGPVTIDVVLPSVPLDQDANSAFDRRPPLEAMASLWLNRDSVVTVYDCGSDTDANGPVYDAVFRLQGYVWIRSPAPVLRDDSQYP